MLANYVEWEGFATSMKAAWTRVSSQMVGRLSIRNMLSTFLVKVDDQTLYRSAMGKKGMKECFV